MRDTEPPLYIWFICKRWLKGIDVMIEKRKGQRYIHTLRLIEMLEADFNSAQKTFANDLMKAAETNNTLADEQWGLRKNRTSTDAAMLKLLTIECARI